MRLATDAVCATGPDNQGVESVHHRSRNTGVSLLLMQNYRVHVCIYFVFVKFIGHTEYQSYSPSQYSAVADHQTAFRTQFIQGDSLARGPKLLSIKII